MTCKYSCYLYVSLENSTKHSKNIAMYLQFTIYSEYKNPNGIVFFPRIQLENKLSIFVYQSSWQKIAQKW